MKKIAWLAAVLLLLGSVAAFSESLVLPENKDYKLANGFVTMKKGTKVILYGNGAIQKGILAFPFKFNIKNAGELNFPADKEMTFSPDGKVKSGYISAESRLQTMYGFFNLPKNGAVSFHDNGYIFRLDLKGTNVLRGLPGSKTIMIKDYIIFSEKGIPSDAVLAHDNQIGDYTFKAGRISFHNTGHVKEGTLAKEYVKRKGALKFKKVKYPAGKSYSFNDRGEIQ